MKADLFLDITNERLHIGVNDHAGMRLMPGDSLSLTVGTANLLLEFRGNSPEASLRNGRIVSDWTARVLWKIECYVRRRRVSLSRPRSITIAPDLEDEPEWSDVIE